MSIWEQLEYILVSVDRTWIGSSSYPFVKGEFDHGNYETVINRNSK